MTKSAFRSSTRHYSAIGGEDDGFSNGAGSHRRSRSLSRSSGRFPPPPPPPEPDDFATPRGRFVNKVRGSGFPEISLDDLADEFFRARIQSDEESEPSSAAARSSRRRSGLRYWMDTESSRRRGRSVSGAPDWGASQLEGFLDSSTPRRRRSISIARHRRIILEDNTDCHSSSNKNWKIKQQLSHDPSISSHLSRIPKSQKDFFHCRDNYSSHSSVTDDERDAHFSRCGVERTFQTVYAQEKEEQSTTDGEHVDRELRQKEVTIVDEDIIMELEKIMSMAEPMSTPSSNIQPKSSDFVQAIGRIRRSYTEKLEKSEKRKQDLLAELAVEEERGQELSTIVKELLPSPKRSFARESYSRPRRGSSNERTRICKRLSEEAERYFEDFLSSVEDTDISSFDGERSETSLSFKDQRLHSFTKGAHESMKIIASEPHDTDGILLPWLQWEISADPSPSCKNIEICREMQKTMAGSSNAGEVSPERRSPGGNGSSFVSRYMDRSCTKVRSKLKNSAGGGSSSFNMEEYSMLQHSEDLLFEMLKQRQRIYQGSLILCGRCLP